MAVMSGVVTLLVAGCSFTPIREVESTRDDTPADTEPAVLAFDDETTTQTAETAGTGDGGVADEPARTPAAAAFLEERESGAWTVATSEATIGVHSAPDYLYTRLGVLGPGDSVIGTGRRVATDAVD